MPEGIGSSEARTVPGRGARDVHLRLLVESARDCAIFAVDANGNVASWNRGAELIKGYTESEILGKPYTAFFDREDVAQGKPRGDGKPVPRRSLRGNPGAARRAAHRPVEFEAGRLGARVRGGRRPSISTDDGTSPPARMLVRLHVSRDLFRNARNREHQTLGRDRGQIDPL